MKMTKAVHITDLQDYVRCPRMWNWSSPLRGGLQPAIPPPPLFLGQGVHIAMYAGYKGSIGSTMTFDTWAAGDTFHKWSTTRLKQAVEYSGPLWKSEEAAGLQALGLGMIGHYSLWAPQFDPKLELVAAEQSFSLPLGGISGFPPNVVYDGRIDGLVKASNGDLYVLEFKTARNLGDRDLSGVFRGMQPTAYLWAARQLYGNEVKGVLYRMLLKRIPSDPIKLKNGGISRDKKQRTTKEWVQHKLLLWAEDIADENEKVHVETLYAGMLEMATPTLSMLDSKIVTDERTWSNGFFMQKLITKTDTQIKNAMHVIRTVGYTMMSSPWTFPIPGYHCSWCKFKLPCDLLDLDLDYKAVLDAEYAERDYWEEVEYT